MKRKKVKKPRRATRAGDALPNVVAYLRHELAEAREKQQAAEAEVLRLRGVIDDHEAQWKERHKRLSEEHVELRGRYQLDKELADAARQLQKALVVLMPFAG